MEIILLGFEHCWRVPFSRIELIRLVKGLCNSLSLEYLEIFLVRDITMIVMNKKYMNCYGVTNILSFSMDEQKSSGGLVLSIDTIYRESLLYKQDIRSYYISLLLHGISHVLGHEHGVEMDEFCNNLLKEYNIS